MDNAYSLSREALSERMRASCCEEWTYGGCWDDEDDEDAPKCPRYPDCEDEDRQALNELVAEVAARVTKDEPHAR